MANQTTQIKNEARPQTFTGKVVSSKMKDTAVVVVEHYIKHPKYGKYKPERQGSRRTIQVTRKKTEKQPQSKLALLFPRQKPLK